MFPFVRNERVCVVVFVPNGVKKFGRLQRFTAFLALLPPKSLYAILQANRYLYVAMQESELREPSDMSASSVSQGQERVPIECCDQIGFPHREDKTVV